MSFLFTCSVRHRTGFRSNINTNRQSFGNILVIAIQLQLEKLPFFPEFNSKKKERKNLPFTLFDVTCDALGLAGGSLAERKRQTLSVMQF